MGLNMYDAMSWRRGREDDEEWSPARHRIIDGAETLELAPALAAREPTSSYLFYDCQTDDSRLVLTVLGEAERFGAVCVNGCEVTGLVERERRAAGVIARDAESGGEFEIRAENVVNATGVWADRLRPDELYDAEEVPRIRPSRGTHVTMPREALPVDAGVIVPAGGGRTIFVLPWLGRTLVGTTDNDYEGELEHIPASGEDVTYLLEALNGYFGTRLAAGDLSAAYAGVRPLISTGDPKKSVDISRKAELYETSSGLVTITGGKLTTWRRMARLAVDRIVEREGREAPCRTHEIPLGMPANPEDLLPAPGVDAESRAHLAARYGHAAVGVLELAEERPELAARVVADLPDILAEAVFAARREQTRSLADVLLRRTRLGLLAARELSGEGAAAPRLVAGALAGELGWDEARVDSELERWLAVVKAEGLAPEAAPTPAPSAAAPPAREAAPLREGVAPEEAA
jgi:glycerol-3-phosphate dehydrogenase